MLWLFWTKAKSLVRFNLILSQLVNPKTLVPIFSIYFSTSLFLASRIHQVISQDSSTMRYSISTWWQMEDKQGRSLKKLKTLLSIHNTLKKLKQLQMHEGKKKKTHPSLIPSFFLFPFFSILT